MTVIAKYYHTCPDFQHIAQLYIMDTPPKYSITYSLQLELALISKIAQDGSKQLCIPSNCRKREQDGTIMELRETLIQNAHTTLGHMSGQKTYDYSSQTMSTGPPCERIPWNTASSATLANTLSSPLKRHKDWPDPYLFHKSHSLISLWTSSQCLQRLASMETKKSNMIVYG